MSITKTKYRIGEVICDSNVVEPRVNPSDVCLSWLNTFNYKKEDKENNIDGLRSPQLGAIHATLAHWEVSKDCATIVMPTGTGKTETMLSLLVIARCKKLLVVVPTDALRTQISNKFISLGLLKTLELIKDDSLCPIVGLLNHKPSNNNELVEFFDLCNVVVTTMSIVGNLSLNYQKIIADKCSHLFIDEAHHIAAETWGRFKNTFYNNYILQFTATPFRNDNKPIKDKIIFNYPLSKAQDEGYFRQIEFLPIEEWNPEKYDESIAEKAVQKLREDLSNGYNHLLMARVKSIDRAEQVLTIYNKFNDLKSVAIHSNSTNKEELRKDILDLKYQIIVCVDMLGEGFDLPNLKIAAFHDIKKSLPITLQLAGRFTRDSRDEKLGNASVIVNLATADTTEELEQLYASDADWNKILPLLSQSTIQNQVDFHEFIRGFDKFPNEIQLQNVKPALSTVVFKTNVESWLPDKFRKGIQGIEDCEQLYFDINTQQNVLVIVTGNRTGIKWGNIDDLYELSWTLYIIYWNQAQQLLFINSSNNGSSYDNLAKHVTNDTASLLSSENVYRCLYDIAQLKVNNVGLKDQYDKLIGFTMHVGQDIEPALTKTQTDNKIKSNIFCSGYENGEKTTIGCSYKGRIWSKRSGNIEEFVRWCNHIGDKLLNSSINANEVLKNAVFLKILTVRPNLYPISIDWHEDLFLLDNFDSILLYNKDGMGFPIYHFELELINPSLDSNIQFKVKHKNFSSTYELQFCNVSNRDTIQFNCLSNPLTIGKKGENLSDYFHKQSPIIRFIDGSYLEGNLFSPYKFKGAHYDKNLIETWDWSGVDIRKETQGKNKETDSIQFHVIQKLKQQNYDVIFDDDDAGEIADIIAVKVNDSTKEIQVELYHLKYSHGDNAGARISDLYEVCGQAQKSIFWKGKGAYELFKRMISRTIKTEKQRIEVGDIKMISLLKDKSKRTYSSNFKIYIVQPGLSKGSVSQQQLELIAVTENHLMETFRIKFGVIASN